MTFPVIDAHQHVWDPSRAEYDWLTSDAAPIDTVMTFADVAPELRAAGVDFTVQVQSADNAEDTELMKESAAHHPEVAGIVGYAPLDDPGRTARTLASWEGDPLMVGVRTLIHAQDDPDWLLRPDVDASLGMLEERGLPFDVVAVLPRHVEIVPLVAARHPRLRMVIDHLAKPPIGVGDGAEWGRLMAAAADCENVYAKVSGLYSATGDSSAWTTDQIRPFVDRALEMFGAQRLMYGGDWPISVLAGGYSRVWQGLRPLFDELDAEAREHVLGRTAAEFYRLDTRRLGLTR
ncbi:L-fuconolactonase [Microbacterium sp. AG157]|uniref:Metal-dependent hydrolase n=1 Tax=Microbacterium testaceum TaxID=2033 RepID=A0A4Y3QKQ2_MICTE|nr:MULTISPECIES: amidohydrolase family protein [Microbacterium]PNW10487.1 metal-dependent hydrolase [Microbacterium testaceum]REC98539.1 L-fuconolactonase [Microbacterium sp. AG157]WJS90127.1 amidohydrolase family protein [Microbacterium testaceum]GEB45263.1 metal-dependent hydrolase [Microbacterium testaceum]